MPEKRFRIKCIKSFLPNCSKAHSFPSKLFQSTELLLGLMQCATAWLECQCIPSNEPSAALRMPSLYWVIWLAEANLRNVCYVKTGWYACMRVHVRPRTRARNSTFGDSPKSADSDALVDKMGTFNSSIASLWVMKMSSLIFSFEKFVQPLSFVNIKQSSILTVVPESLGNPDHFQDFPFLHKWLVVCIRNCS